MPVVDTAVSDTLPFPGTAELPLRTVPHSSKMALGDVQHTENDSACPNYGVKAGHFLGFDQSQMNVTTTNSYHYNLPSATAFNQTTAASDGRSATIHWLDRLAGLDFSDTHRTNLSKRHRGTGAWFLNHAKFRQWCEGPMRTLWCHGILGSGKTILSSTVIEHLKATQRATTTDTACLFIFFSDQQKASQTPYNLFIELLRQLVCHNPELSEQTRRLHDQCKSRDTRPGWDNMLDVIQQEIRRFSKVSLVIDALDACPSNAKETTREDFLEAIRKLPAIVSLFITSRQRRHALYDLGPVEEVRLSLDENDLQSYLRAQIQKHSSHNQLLAMVNADTIISGVSRNAKGMFLLACLQMSVIARQRTRADLESALEGLPSDIHETYDKTRQRVSTHDLPIVDRILLWVTFAMRPLTVDELRCILAVKDGITNASTAALHMLEEGDLTTVCAGLVTIDPEAPARFVRLVHPTAETYFKSYFEHQAAHSTIATTCLRYLLFEDLRLQIPDPSHIRRRLQELPFLLYAALHWGHHVRNAQNPETVGMTIDFLNQKENLTAATQIMDFDGNVALSALWMASHFGLETVVDHLLRKNSCMLNETSCGETAMHAAADKGHLSVVDRLCSEKDIEPDFTTEVGRTPLSLAAENGHHAVVERLLSSGKVNPDSTKMSALYQGRTPLSWAAGNGQTKTVRHLLATGQVDVNSTTIAIPHLGRTPLIWAAANGHRDVVKLLLHQDKTNPSLEDGDGRTALSWAAVNGHRSVVQLLLQTDRAGAEARDMIHKQRPADLAYESKQDEVVKLLLTYPMLDSKDERGRTALSHKAGQGNTGLVKVLLGLGADPNAKAEDDWTPLIYAADNGRTDIAELLLEKGANQEGKCSTGRTSLSHACEGGHKAIVQLLLDRGACPDIPDWNGRTPLSYAAEAGHEAIVASLISCEKSVNIDSQSTGGIFPGRTPLSWAAGRGRNRVVTMLLRNGADVNLKKNAYLLASPFGLQGPVMWAARNGHWDVVWTLIETGRVRTQY